MNRRKQYIKKSTDNPPLAMYSNMYSRNDYCATRTLVF